MVTILLFYLFCCSIFLIDLQQTPLKFLYLLTFIYTKSSVSRSRGQLSYITKIYRLKMLRTKDLTCTSFMAILCVTSASTCLSIWYFIKTLKARNALLKIPSILFKSRKYIWFRDYSFIATFTGKRVSTSSEMHSIQ